MTTMTQDGYLAVIEYDPELDTFAGRVVNLSSPVTFYGRTPEELRKEFMASVRTYLDICRERSIEPEKPYSGRFNVRLSPELHRKAALAAALSGQSLNALVSDAIAKETESVIETNLEPRPGFSRPEDQGRS